MQVAGDDPSINPRIVLVNGAVGGMSAEMVQQPDSGRGKQYWDTVDEKLKAAGVTRAAGAGRLDQGDQPSGR